MTEVYPTIYAVVYPPIWHPGIHSITSRTASWTSEATEHVQSMAEHQETV